jgi:hypothetical protein
MYASVVGTDPVVKTRIEFRKAHVVRIKSRQEVFANVFEPAFNFPTPLRSIGFGMDELDTESRGNILEILGSIAGAIVDIEFLWNAAPPDGLSEAYFKGFESL